MVSHQPHRFGKATAFILPMLVIVLLVVFNLAACATGSGNESSGQNAASDYDPMEGVRVITSAEPNTPAADDMREPWLGQEAWNEALAQREDYINEYPEPQNVQVLTDMSTAEIWDYMEVHVSGALGVSCQYCHDINNYAGFSYIQKTSGMRMLTLVRDLNAQHIVQLPNWQGNYVTCATCHHFEPIDMPAFSESYVDEAQEIEDWIEVGEERPIDTAAIDPNDSDYVLQHPKTEPNLAMVLMLEEQIQQYVLPPLDQSQGERQKYIAFDGIYYSTPDCYTCHRGNRVPTGVVNQADLQAMPDGGKTVLPPALRSSAAE
jgi:photosynthetic reaction center cytochrome c subunit